MQFISQMDLSEFISENYITFLLLGGLLIVMLAYRDIHLPATKSFLLILFVLFLMSIANSVERWAVLDPSRETVRIVASVIHYILQPFVIYLELVIILTDRAGNKDKQITRRTPLLLLSLPIFINTIIYQFAPFIGKLVFYYDGNYWFHRGPLGYSIYIVTFFYLILLLVWSIRFFRHDRRKSIILFFMVGIAVLTGVLEGINLVTGYIDEAFALGVFLYYMYLVTVHETTLQISLAHQELELSKSREKLLREQIRPHFIFNSLHIIKALIRTDQEKAIRGVQDFSDYLQANLDAITSDSLIPFEDELTHIDAYTSLALADESKNITIQYDIQERYFRVPPLTIEPLVENAIRHGVRKGGTVLIQTVLKNDTILITVSDDGDGFDTGTKKEQERTGIGLSNARKRLAALCGGTLTIQSDKNGTVVKVKIPVNRGGIHDNEHPDKR